MAIITECKHPDCTTRPTARRLRKHFYLPEWELTGSFYCPAHCCIVSHCYARRAAKPSQETRYCKGHICQEQGCLHKRLIITTPSAALQNALSKPHYPHEVDKNTTFLYCPDHFCHGAGAFGGPCSLPRKEGGLLCSLHECRIPACKECVFGEKGGVMGNRFCIRHTCRMMFCLNPVVQHGKKLCVGHGENAGVVEPVRQMEYRAKHKGPEVAGDLNHGQSS